MTSLLTFKLVWDVDDDLWNYDVTGRPEEILMSLFVSRLNSNKSDHENFILITFEQMMRVGLSIVHWATREELKIDIKSVPEWKRNIHSTLGTFHKQPKTYTLRLPSFARYIFCYWLKYHSPMNDKSGACFSLVAFNLDGSSCASSSEFHITMNFYFLRRFFWRVFYKPPTR